MRLDSIRLTNFKNYKETEVDFKSALVCLVGKNGSGKTNENQSEVDAALDILDLSPPIDAATAKAQYITLVKQHHPDANGGDKVAEERLKLINQAYETLKQNFGA